MEELMESLAYLFQRKGKDELTEKELSMSISMDLGWFSPDEAKQLIDVGLELKLLSRTEEGITPTFDYKSLSIPIDFTPKRNILEVETQEPLLLAIVRNIEDKTKIGKNTIMAEVNKEQNTLKVDIEVAAILVAKKYDVDISGFLREVEQEIFKRAEQSNG
ncbi:MAG: DUF2240 family protein [Thermoplasmata archaeon]|nr:MAG: DUF2240 family protein [Thermoplasmata archaeon]